MATPGNPVPTTRYLETKAAYDRWSEVYDTDGNFLQALDSEEMAALLPELFGELEKSLDKPLTIVELGCGTGRNTVRLLVSSGSNDITSITALDLSPGMLEVARRKVEAARDRLAATMGHEAPVAEVHFATYDLLSSAPPPSCLSTVSEKGGASAVLCTLVIEHLPLPEFFTAAARMLLPGGFLLLTNMHAEMGRISQAGFVDRATGERIRPVSYAHTVEEMLDIARGRGFEVAVGFRERAVLQEDVSRLGLRSVKWVGTRVWFGGILRLGNGIAHRNDDPAS